MAIPTQGCELGDWLAFTKNKTHKDMDTNTRLSELTLDDIRMVLREEIATAMRRERQTQAKDEGKLISGVNGICQYLGISKNTYYKLLEDTRFSSAVNQTQRLVFALSTDLNEAIKRIRQ